MEEEKSKKGLYIGLIIFLLLCLVGSGLFIYKRTYMEPMKKEETKEESQKDGFVYLDTSDYKNTLDVYKNKNSDLCLAKNDNCSDVAFTIKTETENAKLISLYLLDFVLYDDNGLKVYNVKSDKYQKINLENTYKEYKIYPTNSKENIIGIVYKDSNDNVGYYNVLLNKKMYENKYTYIEQIDDNYLNAFDDNKSTKNGKAYLLNSNEEKIELESDIKDSNGFEAIKINNLYYFFDVSGTGGLGFGVNKIYGNDKNIIYDKGIENENVSIVNNDLYLKDGNKIIKYSNSGDILLTSDEYSNLKGSVMNYAIYVDNGKLLMQNIDNKDVIEITTWNNNYKYIEVASQYYNKEDLEKYNHEEGIYIVIETGTNKADVYHIDSNLKINKLTVEDYLASGFGGTYTYNYKK